MDFKIIYEQDYCEHLDITIIKENIYQDGDIIKQKISGFYYGEPCLENLTKFKNKNIIDLQEQKKDYNKEITKDIKEELLQYIESMLLNFESEAIKDIQKLSDNPICYDFNICELLKNIEKNININIWELKEK